MNLSLFKTRSNPLICFCFLVLVAAPVQGADLCRFFIEQLGVEAGQTLTVYSAKSRRPKVVYGVGEELVLRAHGKTVEMFTKHQTHKLQLPVVVRGLSVLPYGEIEEGMPVRPHLFAVEHTEGFRIYRFNGAKNAILDSTSVGSRPQLAVESFAVSPFESILTPLIFTSTDKNLNLRAVGMDFGFRRSSLEFLDNTLMDTSIHGIAIAPHSKSPQVVDGPNSFVVGVVDSLSISAFDLEGRSIAIIDSRVIGPPARVKRILIAGKVMVDGESEPHMAFHVFTGNHLQTFALVRNVLKPVVDRQLRGRVESAAVGGAPGDLHYLMRDAAGLLHRVRLQVSGSLVLEEQVFPAFDLFPPGNN